MIDLRLGDCVDVMRSMPDASAHCCVTSPPYFGLRDYGVAGQIGLESTPDAYVAKMVEVFVEVKRVLRDDGTLWLNLGDSYAADNAYIGNRNVIGGNNKGRGSSRTLVRDGLKHKDLIGIPWRVAFALQSDGWYLRSDIIWHKPNPMPESVRDRPTKSHEYLFLLSKSGRYHYDADAVREDSPVVSPRQFGRKVAAAHGVKELTGNMRPGVKWSSTGGRNRRSVWTVATRPFKGAHFATFPPKLIEPCILAGCPAGGTVLDPFSGAGTTGVVAKTHGRSYIGIELNPDYRAMAARRIHTASEEAPCLKAS